MLVSEVRSSSKRDSDWSAGVRGASGWVSFSWGGGAGSQDDVVPLGATGGRLGSVWQNPSHWKTSLPSDRFTKFVSLII